MANGFVIKSSDLGTFSSWLDECREEHIYHMCTEYDQERAQQARDEINDDLSLTDEEREEQLDAVDGEEIIRNEMSDWRWELREITVGVREREGIADDETIVQLYADDAWGDTTARAIASWNPPVPFTLIDC